MTTEADRSNDEKASSPIWLQITLGLILGSIVLMVTGVIPTPANWLGGGDADVQGSVLIMKDQDVAFSGTSCEGAGSLSSIRPGATIILFQGDDTVSTTLSDGETTPEGNCRLSFDIDGLSTGQVRAQVSTLSTRGNISEHPREGHLWVTFGFGN